MHLKTIPGTSFLAKDRFLVDFWVSKGTQKLLKPTESFWDLGPGDAPGASLWSKKVPRNGQAPAIEQFSTIFVDFNQKNYRIFDIVWGLTTKKTSKQTANPPSHQPINEKRVGGFAKRLQ